LKDRLKIPLYRKLLKRYHKSCTTTYKELAARRYKQHKWQKRKGSLAKRVVDFILRALKALIKAMQKTRVIKKRTVEKVIVE